MDTTLYTRAETRQKRDGRFEVSDRTAKSGQRLPEKPTGTGTFLGFPLEGFGLLTSLILTVSSGLFAMCVVTGLSIFGLLIWNQLLHHKVNYADTYLYLGFPAAVVVWTIAFCVFGTLWVRAKFRAS